MKQRTSLLNSIDALLVRIDIRIKKEKPAAKQGFNRVIASQEWHEAERLEIDIRSRQVECILENCRQPQMKITFIADTLRGYGHLSSIKATDPCPREVFLCAIGDIEPFPEPGYPAAYFGITPRASKFHDRQRTRRINKSDDNGTRAALVQCTLVTMKYTPCLKAFHKRIKIRRGTESDIIATAGKLLNTSFRILEAGWVFKDLAALKKTCNQS